MKKNFTKFTGWLLTATCFTFLFSSANATIVYHDESPDVVQTQTTNGGQVFAVDMDGDLTPDFSLSIFKGDSVVGPVTVTGNFVAITCLNGGEVAETTSSPASLAKAFGFTDPIDGTSTYQTNVSVLRYSGTVSSIPTSGGNFTGAFDYYIGVRFSIGVNTHYGWIRVLVADDATTYTIKDWAYEDTPDASINAGFTPTANKNAQLASSTTIVNKNNVIEMIFSKQLSGSVKVVNMAGTIIASEKINGETCRVNLQERNTGIYNLVFETNEGEFAKKIYLE